jgi:hypothetical protein
MLVGNPSLASDLAAAFILRRHLQIDTIDDARHLRTQDPRQPPPGWPR